MVTPAGRHFRVKSIAFWDMEDPASRMYVIVRVYPVPRWRRFSGHSAVATRGDRVDPVPKRPSTLGRREEKGPAWARVSATHGKRRHSRTTTEWTRRIDSYGFAGALWHGRCCAASPLFQVTTTHVVPVAVLECRIVVVGPAMVVVLTPVEPELKPHSANTERMMSRSATSRTLGEAAIRRVRTIAWRVLGISLAGGQSQSRRIRDRRRREPEVPMRRRCAPLDG